MDHTGAAAPTDPSLQAGGEEETSHVCLFTPEVRYLYKVMVDADIRRKCDNSQLPFVFVLIKT